MSKKIIAALFVSMLLLCGCDSLNGPVTIEKKTATSSAADESLVDEELEDESSEEESSKDESSEDESEKESEDDKDSEDKSSKKDSSKAESSSSKSDNTNVEVDYNNNYYTTTTARRTTTVAYVPSRVTTPKAPDAPAIKTESTGVIVKPTTTAKKPAQTRPITTKPAETRPIEVTQPVINTTPAEPLIPDITIIPEP
ncbi:MAG: hypothetical protein Q4D35_00645 [Ruminococcus sp.]|nr:hypothetical protein [Ruminococcus sp.]